MTNVHVGVSSLKGDVAHYAEKFDLLEVRPIDLSLPKPGRLRQWRKDVPPGFVFSVVLPTVVAELKPSPAVEGALAAALATAEALEARCIVITTPPSVTPTAQNRARLRELVDRLPRDVVTLAWEPRGIWTTEEADALARSIGLSLVVDAAREEPPRGSVLYTRLRGIGVSTRLSEAATERVRAAMRARREAFVVIEASSPARIAQALRRPLGGVPRTMLGSSAGRPPISLSAEDEEQ